MNFLYHCFYHQQQKVSVLQADPYEYPSDLVKKAVKKVHTRDGIQPQDYVLKIRGRLEFLLGNHPLSRYKVRIGCCNWNGYTPCENHTVNLTYRECEFLLGNHPLSWYNVRRAIEIEIHTPCVKTILWILHRGSVNSKWNQLPNYHFIESYLCETIPHKGALKSAVTYLEMWHFLL